MHFLRVLKSEKRNLFSRPLLLGLFAVLYIMFFLLYAYGVYNQSRGPYRGLPFEEEEQRQFTSEKEVMQICLQYLQDKNMPIPLNKNWNYLFYLNNKDVETPIRVHQFLPQKPTEPKPLFTKEEIIAKIQENPLSYYEQRIARCQFFLDNGIPRRDYIQMEHLEGYWDFGWYSDKNKNLCSMIDVYQSCGIVLLVLTALLSVWLCAIPFQLKNIKNYRAAPIGGQSLVVGKTCFCMMLLTIFWLTFLILGLCFGLQNVGVLVLVDNGVQLAAYAPALVFAYKMFGVWIAMLFVTCLVTLLGQACRSQKSFVISVCTSILLILSAVITFVSATGALARGISYLPVVAAIERQWFFVNYQSWLIFFAHLFAAVGMLIGAMRLAKLRERSITGYIQRLLC